MNKKEAKQVLGIISKADGECPYCVTDLLNHFVLKFPKHKDIAKEYYEKFSVKEDLPKLKEALKSIR